MEKKFNIKKPQISETPDTEKNSEKYINDLKNEESNETFKFIDSSPQNVLQGLIWSEILGKPKCLRKGR